MKASKSSDAQKRLYRDKQRMMFLLPKFVAKQASAKRRFSVGKKSWWDTAAWDATAKAV